MAHIALALFVLLKYLTAVTAYTDPACANYDHPNYGCVGQCVSTSDCPGGKYISNLCPSQPAGVKCCFTVGTDPECTDYKHWLYGQVGYCISTSQCPSSAYVSNKCPSYGSGIKCCFKKPTDTCSASGSCSGTASSLACKIQKHSKITLISNNGVFNSKGSYDGADAKSNIIDACNGKQAKRSSYSCSSGSAPDGSVCLSSKVLQYVLDVANAGYNIQVNALAGACHSSTSRHYQGTAVDLQISSGDNYSAWMNKCASSGAVENLGPGYPGHSTHTHCAFAG